MADKETKSLRGRIKRRTTKVYNLAEEIELVATVGGMKELAMSSEQVQAVLTTGQLPLTAVAGVNATILHHGRVLCSARADLERCVEELPREWVEFMITSVCNMIEEEAVADGKMLNLGQVVSEGLSMDAVVKLCATASPTAGRQFWLYRQVCMLDQMKDKAEAFTVFLSHDHSGPLRTLQAQRDASACHNC
jgi:hypothetical protein